MPAATRPSPLVSADELARLVASGEPRLRILDLRWYLGRPGAGRRAYEAGHVPGASYLDLEDELTDPAGLGAPGRHPLPSPARFAADMAALGIQDDSVVVAYDDVGGWVAARLWWMLDDLGFGRAASERGDAGAAGRGAAGSVRVLDGGFQAWLASGGAVTKAEVPVAPAAPGAGAASRLTLAPSWSRVIERDDLRARLGSVVLLDARGAPRYRGEIEPVDPVAGHIPTALSLPTDAVLGSDGRFLPIAALRDRFLALGVGAGEAAGGRPVVTSCGSGVSACIHALAMRAAGLPDPILYAGSYSDWSRSGYPVATGPEPGDPR